MTQIWRINLKPEPRANVDPQKFCIERNIMGIGWPVILGNTDPTWDNYSKLAHSLYYIEQKDRGWLPAINALKWNIAINDLCWTRTGQGIYYLGRITSDWRYESGEDYAGADIVNLRDCEWLKVGTAENVAGKIVNSFIPRATVQRVNGRMIEAFSTYLYNELSKDYKFKIPPPEPDYYSLFSSDDCEDIVGLYLQSLGYYIVPSTCKNSTLAYEYVLINKETHRKATVQVKNGYVDLDSSVYSSDENEVFLFTTKGKYLGPRLNNVYCLDKSVIDNFIVNNLTLLPRKIKTWIEMSKKLRGVQ